MAVIVEGFHNGLDLCSLQDHPPLDPKAIKDAGFEYVYIKSSQYSKTTDTSFHYLVARLRDVGLFVGAYHFCSHDSDPIEQARFFARASKTEVPLDLPHMIDWEFCTASAYPNHPKHCVDWLLGFTYELEDRTKRQPIIYTFPNYAERHQPYLGQIGWTGVYPLCYASYKSEPGPNGGFVLVPWLPEPAGDGSMSPLHPVPKPWSKALVWQYSGNNGLKVPGIAGDCDRQVFLGTEEEWKRFTSRDITEEYPYAPVEGKAAIDELPKQVRYQTSESDQGTEQT